jgi:hypothetical protein
MKAPKFAPLAAAFAVGLAVAALSLSCKMPRMNPLDPGAGMALASLSSSAGPYLMPRFDPRTTEYEVVVPNGTAAVTVTASPAQADASVTVNGFPSSPGRSSSAIALPASGPCRIVVGAIASDGSKRDYGVTVYRAPAPVFKTGQTKVYNDDGSFVASPSGTYQDGELRKGRAWPSPRFTRDFNANLLDLMTGLVWSRTPNNDHGADVWMGALDGIEALTKGSLSDWRMANISELRSLAHYGCQDDIGYAQPQNFSGTDYWLYSAALPDGNGAAYSTGGVNGRGAPGNVYISDMYYWSSTIAASDVVTVKTFFMGPHRSFAFGNGSENYWSWGLRGHSSVLPKTGQTSSYHNGDDGYYQEGVAWPDPRFLNAGDGTVSDRLTGLMWAASSNIMKSRDPSFDTDGTAGDGKVTFGRAVAYVAKLNAESYLGYADWRLPNIRELDSLINAGASQGDRWLASAGFTDVSSGSAEFWTCTCYDATAPSSGYFSGISAQWTVELVTGSESFQGRSANLPLIILRGGEG